MTRLLLVLLVLFGPLAACGGSPTGPSSGVQGVWSGSWARTSCTETASAGLCGLTPQSGSLRLTLTQSGTSVSGTLDVNLFTMPVTGSVGSDGALTLSGQTRAQGVTVVLTTWSTTRNGTAMSGSFSVNISPDETSLGRQTVQANLQNVTLNP